MNGQRLSEGTAADGGTTNTLHPARLSPRPAGAVRLLDQVRHAIRTLHYSYRTEQAYVDWARRFILFHGKRHPAELGAREVGDFLSHLAVDRHVSASTQTQARSALLFLYRRVLDVQLPWLDDVAAARTNKKLPVVLTMTEVRQLLEQMNGTQGLVATLLYGTGMRLMEGLRLRVKDVEFERREIIVRDGKGGKDRVTVLPENLVLPLQEHLRRRRAEHQSDAAEGFGAVWLPDALATKYPAASTAWGWQWSSPQRPARSTHARERSSDTTFTNSPCSARCTERPSIRGSTSLARRMSCVTRSRRTCSRPDTTSEPSRNS